MIRRIILSGLSVFSKAGGALLSFILIARAVGPSDFGYFSFCFALAVFAGLILDYGMPLQLMTSGQNDKHKTIDLLQKCLVAKIYLLVPFLLLLIVFGIFSTSFVLTLLLGIAMAASVFAEAISAALRTFGSYAADVVAVGASSAVLLLLILAVSVEGGTIVHFAVCFIVARFVQLVIIWNMSRRLIGFGPLKFIGLHELLSFLSRGKNYAIDGLITTSFSYLDAVIVKLMLGPAVLGIYSAAQRLIQGVMLGAPSLGNVFAPRLASAVGSRRFERESVNVLFFSAACGALLASVFHVLPTELYEKVLGKDYRGVGVYLQALSFVVFVRYAASGCGIVLSVTGHQSYRVGAQCVALIALVVSCVVSHTASGGLSGVIISVSVAYSCLYFLYAFKVLQGVSGCRAMLGAYCAFLITIASILIGASIV